MFEAEISADRLGITPRSQQVTDMPINILMPALSPTMEKGNLAKWLKKEGDKVKSGDVIAEIETDKATMEVEAVDEGTIAKILVPEGTQDVAVNEVIAVLAGDGEDVKAAGAGAASAPPKAAPRRQRRRPRLRPQRRRQPPAAAAAALRRRSRRQPRRRPTATPASSPRRWRDGWRRKPASSSARITGSGPHGRVIARDVEEAKSGKGLKAPGRARPAAAPAIAPSMSDQQIRALFEPGSYEVDAARRHAPDHRAAADGVGADHPAFLSDDRLRHRQAARGARGDQRRRAEGQGRRSRPTSSRSTISSSRRWRSRCSGFPTPM